MATKAASKRAEAKVFLVDDHTVMRTGLVELINQERGMRVCGEAAGAEEALQQIPGSGADLVLIDLSLQGTGGLELLKDLTNRDPKLPVLVLSMHDEAVYAERALHAGARGYIMKDKAIGELRNAIRRVLSGKVYLSEKMADQLLQTVAYRKQPREDSPLSRLSDRELEVFELIGRGVGTGKIAKKLHLSVKTIETYRAHIKDKLNLNDGAELVQHAVHWLHRL